MRMKSPNYLTSKFNIIGVLVILMFFSGCDKNIELITESEQTPITFSALKLENNTVRVTGNEWDNGDQIGVFAHKSGEVLTAASIINNYANYPYYTSGSGYFYGLNGSIYYPKDGKALDITAYYPYTAEVKDLKVPIDIAAQQEFLYSNNLKELTKPKRGEAKNENFNFVRPLAQVVLHISSTTPGASLDGLRVKVDGVPTKATFSLSDGSLAVDAESVAPFEVETTGSISERSVAIMLAPIEQADKVELTFELGANKLYSWKVPHQLEKGKKYSYNIKLNHTDTEIEVAEGYMEIPVYTTSDTAPNSIQVLHMVEDNSWLSEAFTYGDEPIRNFSALYDKENRVPYWVAFPMHPIYMKSGNRTDEWAFDPKIPAEYQPNLLFNGWQTPNLDRGHLMASADRSATRKLNETTFYMSNITPQNSTFNQRNWETLESKVRVWSKEVANYDTLYVVTGVVLPQIPSQFEYAVDIDGKESVIPEYFYKALLRKNKKTNQFSSIAFYMENDESLVHYRDRIISVAELEEKTGFTFFPNLPTAIAGEVKQNKSLATEWK